MQEPLAELLPSGGGAERDDEAFQQVRERVQALISAARGLSDTCADLADALRPLPGQNPDDPLLAGFGRLRAERTAALLDEAASAARGTLGLLESAYGALDRRTRPTPPAPVPTPAGRSGPRTWPDAFLEAPSRAFTVDDEVGTAVGSRPPWAPAGAAAETDPHGMPAIGVAAAGTAHVGPTGTGPVGSTSDRAEPSRAEESVRRGTPDAAGRVPKPVGPGTPQEPIERDRAGDGDPDTAAPDGAIELSRSGEPVNAVTPAGAGLDDPGRPGGPEEPTRPETPSALDGTHRPARSDERPGWDDAGPARESDGSTEAPLTGNFRPEEPAGPVEHGPQDEARAPVEALDEGREPTRLDEPDGSDREHGPEDVDGEGLRAWARPVRAGPPRPSAESGEGDDAARLASAAFAGWIVVDPDDEDDQGRPMRAAGLPSTEEGRVLAAAPATGRLTLPVGGPVDPPGPDRVPAREPVPDPQADAADRITADTAHGLGLVNGLGHAVRPGPENRLSDELGRAEELDPADELGPAGGLPETGAGYPDDPLPDTTWTPALEDDPDDPPPDTTWTPALEDDPDDPPPDTTWTPAFQDDPDDPPPDTTWTPALEDDPDDPPPDTTWTPAFQDADDPEAPLPGTTSWTPAFEDADLPGTTSWTPAFEDAYDSEAPLPGTRWSHRAADRDTDDLDGVTGPAGQSHAPDHDRAAEQDRADQDAAQDRPARAADTGWQGDTVSAEPRSLSLVPPVLDSEPIPDTTPTWGDDRMPAGADPWAAQPPTNWDDPLAGLDLSGAATFARVERPVWTTEPVPGSSAAGDGPGAFPLGAGPGTAAEPPPSVPLDEPAAAVISRQVEAARRHLQAALVVANGPSASQRLGALLTAIEQVLTAVTDLARETRGMLEQGLVDRTFPGEARFLCSPPWEGTQLVGRDAYGDDVASPAGLAKLLRALGYEAHSVTSAGGPAGVQVRADRYSMQVALVEPAGGGRQRWSGALEWADESGASRTWAETLGPVELEDDELARRVDELLRRCTGR